ncbi:MAG: TonB-dependent receptor domain-containing protein, partial [Acidobacteriota bacterium]
NFSEDTQLFGRYDINTDSEVEPFPARPSFENVNDFRQQLVNITLTHSFTPTVLNEFRFGYQFGRSDFTATNPQVPHTFMTGLAAIGGSDNLGGFLGYPQLFTRDTFQWQDVVSFNVGDHFLRAGFDLRRAREDSDFGNTSRPLLYYRGLFDYALDAPYYISAGIDPASGALVGTPREFRSTEVGWFIQDDWKVHPRLTLNLGLRWDYFGPTTEATGKLSSMRFPSGANYFERIANATVGAVDQLYEDDFNNFAPRFGFAWDIFGDSSMALRGGYGISYDKIFFNVGANSRFNPPFFGLASLSDIFFGDDLSTFPLLGPDPDDIFGGFLGIVVAPALGFDERGGVIGTRLNLRVLDPNIRDSYVHSAFLGVQRELPWEMVFEFNYQGTFGKKLGFIGDPARFNGDLVGAVSPLGTFEGDTRLNRLNPSFLSFNLRQNRITSNYHGFNLQLAKRMTQGVAFNAAYTFGHSLDFNSDVFGSGSNDTGSDIFFSDPSNIRLDYGRSNFDINHRFVASFLYEVPFMTDQQGVLGKTLGGWQLTGTFPIQTGLPFSVMNGSRFPAGDYNADGRRNDRPNAPSSGNQFGSAPSTAKFIEGALSADDFSTPELGTNGYLGKNTFTGPAFWTVDFGLFKNFKLPLGEESKLQFRAEFFNLLNRVNLLLPVVDVDDSLFGGSTETFAPRQIQFGLKIIF